MPYIVSRDRRSSFAPTEILRRRRTTVGVDRERLPAIYVATFVWRAPPAPRPRLPPFSRHATPPAVSRARDRRGVGRVCHSARQHCIVILQRKQRGQRQGQRKWREQRKRRGRQRPTATSRISRQNRPPPSIATTAEKAPYGIHQHIGMLPRKRSEEGRRLPLHKFRTSGFQPPCRIDRNDFIFFSDTKLYFPPTERQYPERLKRSATPPRFDEPPTHDKGRTTCVRPCRNHAIFGSTVLSTSPGRRTS